MSSNYKTADEIKTLFKISSQTLHNWRLKGKIKYTALNARNYLYDVDSIEGYSVEQTPRLNIIYARVSNTKQKSDLEGQIQTLGSYANTNGYRVDKVLSDIASGMNPNRKGFDELLSHIIENKVRFIFISFKDRLTRFGYEYLEKWFGLYGTKIIVVNDDSLNNFDKELTEDLISIIHHFSMKMYSHRRQILKQVKKDLEKVV